MEILGHFIATEEPGTSNLHGRYVLTTHIYMHFLIFN